LACSLKHSLHLCLDLLFLLHFLLHQR
jgi:hypothetical protein